MPMQRMRVTASNDDTRQLINRLEALDGVEAVREVDDLMPHMLTDDSSSAGLPDDEGPGFHAIEVDTSDEAARERAQELTEACAHDLGAAVEFVDRF
ncbi:hypothetical protein [Oleiagrimonas sp. C23AA]|uniref:hypothetical protein n=1 Tax=Oleiagrimonas sp. C23AA TaxID=2719047 RepID=UPI00141D949F|nr:hypothetical protein [Oleiagrimonas sp. C23AA]NII09291.1 hypothetical protein [Oleiagrimonas sp. C23AA]